jgi:hypothetical protein
MAKSNNNIFCKKMIFLSGIILCILMLHSPVSAQEEPPRPMKLSPYQNLSFGAFIAGFGGGTVIIYPGGTLTLQLDNSIPSSPFVNTTRPPFRTQVRIGGTLMVGNMLDNPAGDYIGTFSVTFIQE